MGTPKPTFYVALLLVIAGLVGFAFWRFRNVSEQPARLLNLHTPGGFAEYRRELEELRSQGIEPDDAFFERHDVFNAKS